VGRRRPGGRSESMLHFFDSAFFLFSYSRTTVMATKKLRGLPWLAASIRMSQEAIKLLYLSETSEEREQIPVESEI
jgi:hypothetical protein